jgi:glycosyltransferase involved in cell wall biosynthesis
MNVLFLTQQFPFPPSNGGMLRTHHLLKGITKEHHVELVCFAESLPKEMAYENIDTYAALPRSFNKLDRASALFRKMPVYALSNNSQSMGELIRKICAKTHPDLCHIDTLGMASYIPNVPVPSVVDLMDCISLNYKRLASIQSNVVRRVLYLLESVKVERFEREVAGAAAALIACTEIDAGNLTKITGKNVLTIRNGVCVPTVLERKAPLRPVIVFVGFLDYGPNRDAVDFFGNQILPLVRKAFPDVLFEIVGKGQPIALNDMTNVVHLGYVADLDCVYDRATLVVAPLRSGSGVKNKVIEAMARAVPVVGTTLAAEGIDGINGRHYLLADTRDALAATILRVLSSPDLAKRVGAEGQAHVLEHFNWHHAINELLNLYENIAAHGKKM